MRRGGYSYISVGFLGCTLGLIIMLSVTMLSVNVLSVIALFINALIVSVLFISVLSPLPMCPAVPAAVL